MKIAEKYGNYLNIRYCQYKKNNIYHFFLRYNVNIISELRAVFTLYDQSCP